MVIAGALLGGAALHTTPSVQAAFGPIFGPPTQYATGGDGPYSYDDWDLNGDGYPDIATANGASNTVSLLMNCGTDAVAPCNGPGTFGPATILPAGGLDPISIDEKDLDGDVDGDLNYDFATANWGSNNVSVFLNCDGSTVAPCHGPGTFYPPVTYPVRGTHPIFVETAVVNNDKYDDIVTANYGSNSVSVLFNCGTNTVAPCHGPGTFYPAITYPVGGPPQSVEVQDVDNGGFADIQTANGNGTMSVLFNCSAGWTPGCSSVNPKRFGSAVTYPVANTGAVETEDINHDGWYDLVTNNLAKATVEVLYNCATPDVLGCTGVMTDTFGSPITYTTGVTPSQTFHAGETLEVDTLGLGNGPTNFVVANNGDGSNSVTVRVNCNGSTVPPCHGQGSYYPPMIWPVGANPYVTEVQYLDKNSKKIDIVTANRDAGTVSVIRQL